MIDEEPEILLSWAESIADLIGSAKLEELSDITIPAASHLMEVLIGEARRQLNEEATVKTSKIMEAAS